MLNRPYASALILAAAVLALLAGTACSLHYAQTTDGQILDLEVLRAVPVNQAQPKES